MRMLKAAALCVALVGALALALSTVAESKPETERNREFVSRMLDESINARDADVLDEYLSADYVHHGADGIDTGRETHKEAARLYFVAFPDVRFEMLDQIAEGDKVVTRWRFTGTHTGPLQDMAPTGKAVDLTGISIHRIEGGRAVEGWEASNTLLFLQQLGVMPGAE